MIECCVADTAVVLLCENLFLSTKMMLQSDSSTVLCFTVLQLPAKEYVQCIYNQKSTS